MVDRCICCGDIIPEGRQVCPACEDHTHIRNHVVMVRNKKQCVIGMKRGKKRGILL